MRTGAWCYSLETIVTGMTILNYILNSIQCILSLLSTNQLNLPPLLTFLLYLFYLIYLLHSKSLETFFLASLILQPAHFSDEPLDILYLRTMLRYLFYIYFFESNLLVSRSFSFFSESIQDHNLFTHLVLSIFFSMSYEICTIT